MGRIAEQVRLLFQFLSSWSSGRREWWSGEGRVGRGERGGQGYARLAWAGQA